MFDSIRNILKCIVNACEKRRDPVLTTIEQTEGFVHQSSKTGLDTKQVEDIGIEDDHVLLMRYLLILTYVLKESKSRRIKDSWGRLNDMDSSSHLTSRRELRNGVTS